MRGPLRLGRGRLARQGVHARPELLHPGSGEGGDGERVGLQRGRSRRGIVDQIRLRPDDDRWPGDERLVVAPELRAEHGEVQAGVGAREIHDEHQGATPDDVSQEPVTEAPALVRAFDQPGDVGDHRPPVAGLGDAEVRREGRERIVGDLRRGRGET